MPNNVTVHGSTDMHSLAPSVRELWRAVSDQPPLFLPVALAIAYAPDGDFDLAAEAMRGHDAWADACRAVGRFFAAKDGPLDKRRGDFVELVAWELGPFRIGREGGSLRKHHEAALAADGQRLCSAKERVDVVFHVQDRLECIECKANATVWSRSSRAPRKVAYLTCLDHLRAGDGRAKPRQRLRWWVGVVTLEDRPFPIEGIEVLGIHFLRGFMRPRP